MGSAAGDRLIDPRTGRPATNDGPQHEVTIDYSFAIGRYEVTVDEYAAFVAETGHHSQGPCMGFIAPGQFRMSREFDWNRIDAPQTGRHPVVCVNWEDAVAYTRWLSDRTGHSYRLPTEAEWEYAARAGSAGPFFWGRDPARACDYANVRSPGAQPISERQRRADESRGFPCDDGYAAASPVGSFLPNAFGLYDLQGNAWEWVADCNHKDYVGAPNDGSAWLDADGCQFGLIRGGSFLNLVERSSVTVRVGRPRNGRATNMGFRVVRGRPLPLADDDGGVTARADRDSTGGRLFAENCLACHQRADNFHGLYGTDRQSLISTIRGGGNNIMSMPAFGGVLSDVEIATLADYLRAQNGWK